MSGGICKLYTEESEVQQMRSNPENVFYVIERQNRTFVFKNKTQAEEKKKAFKTLLNIDVEIKVMKQSTIEELLGIEAVIEKTPAEKVKMEVSHG